MRTLREFIGYNQKQIIKFEYIVSELHRDLKDLLRKDKSTDEELEESYDKLVIEGYLLMQEIFKKNSEFISNTIGFKDKNLRFTIKMVEDEFVSDVFRSHEINIVIHETEYKDNTAFNTIMSDSTTYYLNNNIEESFKKNEYFNPRLITGLPWNKAWLDHEKKKPSTDYYNSTLVVPMSITSDNEEDSLFYKKYFQNDTIGKLNTKTRVIWGFACFDSKEKDYFDEKDIDLGLIITDMLSTYLIFYYNYAISSKTVLAYEEKYFPLYE